MAGRVCIIGAGLSGLAAIKACLEEGLTPVCLEREADIGGTWRYTDTPGLARPCVHHSLLMNTSKFGSSFSDFPMSPEQPWYCDHAQYMTYIRQYAHAFDLVRHITFGVTVVKVVPVESDESDVVRWEVEYVRGDKNVREVYAGVMYCSGLFSQPRYPHIPGLQDFEGEVVHTHNYRQPKPYVGKRVLVIGLGNSAGEIAAELGGVADKVYVSRGDDGVWVSRRCLLFGMPADALLSAGLMTYLPDTRLRRRLLGWLHNLLVLDHDAWGLRPKKYLFGDSFPLASDHFVPALTSGKILLRPMVSHFSEGHVVYADGSRDQVDVILVGTGYDCKFSYLPEGFVPLSRDKQICCYKNTFLIDPKYRSLGFIGCVRILGAVAPVVEMQSRWYARVLKGSCKLPLRHHMEEHTKRRHQSVHYQHRRDSIYLPPSLWLHVLEELSAELGVQPRPLHYLLSDPALALQLVCGVSTAARYRLEGPGAWAGAREAVMGARLYGGVGAQGGEPAFVAFVKLLCAGVVGFWALGVCLVVWICW